MPRMEQQQERRGRVLLIDDDEQIAGSLQKYLVRRGCTAETARDRKAAEVKLCSSPFDLILVDPYLTGESKDPASLLAAVRSHQPEAVIILLTAYPSSALGNRAMEIGVRAIITKPKPVAHLGDFALGFLAPPVRTVDHKESEVL